MPSRFAGTPGKRTVRVPHLSCTWSQSDTVSCVSSAQSHAAGSGLATLGRQSRRLSSAESVAAFVARPAENRSLHSRPHMADEGLHGGVCGQRHRTDAAPRRSVHGILCSGTSNPSVLSCCGSREIHLTRSLVRLRASRVRGPSIRGTHGWSVRAQHDANDSMLISLETALSGRFLAGRLWCNLTAAPNTPRCRTPVTLRRSPRRRQ